MTLVICNIVIEYYRLAYNNINSIEIATDWQIFM